MVIRPFLTPSSGVEFEDGQKEAQLRHAGFTEIIRRVGITEQVYYPSKEKEETVTTTYYAHKASLRMRIKSSPLSLQTGTLSWASIS